MKEQKGGLSSSTWYLKGKTSNTIKWQATPNGDLAKLLTRNLNTGRGPNDERLKVVEEGGAPATASLRRSDPYRKEECRFQAKSCLVDPKQDCSLMGCIYEYMLQVMQRSSPPGSGFGQGDQGTRRTGQKELCRHDCHICPCQDGVTPQGPKV